MGGILKKIFSSLIGMFLICFIFSSSCCAGTYIDTYYKDDKSEEISKGVTLITGVRLTNRGLIKTEIVKVDLSNKNLKFKNVFNKDSMGAKTKLYNLIKDEDNVVAAINGDFFEMSLTPSFELGVTINDGVLDKITSGEYYNCYSNSLASLLFDSKNNPYFDFVTSNIIFENDKDNLYVSYYNKSGDKEGTVILDGEYFSTSKSMDNRNPNCYKIVVKKGTRNDKITEIVEPGITIDITSGYYVVFLPSNFNRIENFEVGDDVTLTFDLSISDSIQTSIGGAGIFLQDGQIVNNGYIVSGYNARSFVGYDSKKSYLYFGVVGGTTSSNNGVSSNQLGEILKDYGVYTAMHLDGGGSSTLMTKSSFGDTVSQVNDVATQRAIINSLVLTNTSTKTKKLKGIKLDVQDKALLNVAIPFSIFGYDENHKEVTNFSSSNLKIQSDKEIEIDYKNKTIIFKEKGRTNLNATCSGYSDNVYVDIYDALTEIQLLPDPIILDIKEEINLSIIALTKEKYKIAIDSSNCEFVISPSSLAKVSNGKIIGLNSGVGTITVNYDGLSASSIISIGTETITLDDFDENNFTSSSSSEDAKSECEILNGKLVINYEFNKSENEQAAYAKYNSNLLIPKGTTKLLFKLKGDNKGTMLKFKFVDTKGNTFNSIACSDMSSTSNKEYELELPSGYSGELYLESYFVYALNTNRNISSSITIDNLRCIKNLDYSNVKSPKSVTRNLTSINEEIIKTENKDFIFFNNSNNSLLSNYLDFKASNVLNKLDNKNLILSKNTDRLTGIINNDGLKKYYYDDTVLICMSTIAGSVFAKDPYQYGQVEKIISDNNEIKNVIITLDGDLTSSNLSSDKIMLDYILSNCYEEKRINFYVIMFSGNETLDKIENGIRYIRIPSTISNAFEKNILVIRKDENNELQYNLIDIENFIKVYEEVIANDENTNENDNQIVDQNIENINKENNLNGGEDEE